MRWTQDHSYWLAQAVSASLKKNKSVEVLKSEDHLTKEVYRILNQDFDKEKELEKEVRDTLDQLERDYRGEFNRQKMYSMLKNKLAEKKGIVL